MPMGLCNAPAVFQRAMNQILSKHIAQGYCLVYIDDIIIFSKSVEDHISQLDAVLSTLREHNLFCQLPKCTWAQKRIKYLGHIVDGTGVLPDPGKVKALDHWEPPSVDLTHAPSQAEVSAIQQRKVHECRRFLGFMNYFARFIPRYAELAMPLYEQTKNQSVPWTAQCTASWNQLKSALRSATLMHHPIFTKPFHVYMDASIGAIGGVLMQEHDGHMCPIAFIARKLSSAERNYITTEQELLAVVYCFQKWRCYLDGTRVLLHSDHEPLTWLQTQKTPSRRQARWLEYLSRFQYEILYVRGDENVVADALSRMLNAPEEAEEDLPADHWPLLSKLRKDSDKSVLVSQFQSQSASVSQTQYVAFRSGKSSSASTAAFTGSGAGRSPSSSAACRHYSPPTRVRAASDQSPMGSGRSRASAYHGCSANGRPIPRKLRRVTFRVYDGQQQCRGAADAGRRPSVWDPSARPKKRARIASPWRGEDGGPAYDGPLAVSCNTGVAPGASGASVQAAASASALASVPEVSQLRPPRRTLAGGAVGCCENVFPTRPTLLTVVRSQRRAGTPGPERLESLDGPGSPSGGRSVTRWPPGPQVCNRVLLSILFHHSVRLLAQ